MAEPAVYIVSLSCRRFNASAQAELEAKLAVAWQSGARVVGIDFSEVAYIDSLGVSLLMVAHRKRPDGARIVVCALNESVREVFEITQIVRVFDVYASSLALQKAAS